MSDLISRQDTIDRINEYIEEYSEIDSDGNHSEKWCAMQEAKMTIENMPSAQPEHEQNTPPEQGKSDKFGVKMGETCTDTISRKAVIDEAEEWIETYNSGRGGQRERDAIKHVISGIKKLPAVQPEPKWIPCSERLPEPYEYCLWTTIDGRVVYHHCDGLFSKYIAWMPLPEPYTERWEE